MDIQVAIGSARQDGLSLVRTVAENITDGEVVIAVTTIRIQLDGLLPLFLRPIVPAYAKQYASSQITVGRDVPRISLAPQFTDLPRFFEIPRRYSLVDELNIEPFMVARAISQVPCFCGVLPGEAQISNSAVRHSEGSVSRREVGIDGHGTPKERQGSRSTTGDGHHPTRAVGFQCFERRRGSLG